MKTSTYILFLCSAFSFGIPSSSAKSHSTNMQNDRIQTIDLNALGAISNGDSSHQPSLSELMRDCGASTKSAQFDSISLKAANSDLANDQTNKEKEREEYIAESRNQNRRSAAIISTILLIFFIIAGFTSPLFRHKSNKIIDEKSPFSLSRTMLFIWSFALTCSFCSAWGASGEQPSFVLSLPLFFGIILITYIFSFLLERMDNETNKTIEKNQFTLSTNNSFKPFMCISKMQFLLISIVHLGLLCAPAWLYYNFYELSPEVLVVQMISSMIYLGHKASKIQSVHILIFKRPITKANAHR